VKAIVSSSVVLVLAAGASMAQAQTGVLIAQKITTGGAESTSQVQITRTRLRTEVADGAGSKQVVVFDGDRQVMMFINPERKSYSEITKAEVDRLGAQMQDMMAKVPPEMREKVAAMMKGRGMAAAGAPVKTVYKRAGSDKTAKWPCDKYEGYQNNEKTSEICTVEPAALGLSAADFAVTQQFAAFFEKLMPQAAGQMLNFGQSQEQGFSGVPVKSTSTLRGRTTTTEITAVNRQAIPDTVFAVPEGYKKEASPFGRGRGPQ